MWKQSEKKDEDNDIIVSIKINNNNNNINMITITIILVLSEVTMIPTKFKNYHENTKNSGTARTRQNLAVIRITVIFLSGVAVLVLLELV